MKENADFIQPLLNDITKTLATKYKAQGTTFSEMLTHIEESLPPQAVKKMRRLAKIRNRVIHDDKQLTVLEKEQVQTLYNDIEKILKDHTPKPSTTKKPPIPPIDVTSPPHPAVQSAQPVITTSILLMITLLSLLLIWNIKTNKDLEKKLFTFHTQKTHDAPSTPDAIDDSHRAATLKLLGDIYSSDPNPQKDYQKAIEYYSQSARLGNPFAINALGKIYRDGLGVQSDPTKALEYFKLAADLGHHGAVYNIAKAYEHGQGTPQDLDTAIKYYQHAAELGNSASIRKIIQLQNN